MVTRVQEWGNSQGLRLAKHLLDDARIGVGDEVDVSVREGAIVIVPIKRERGKLSLKALVARIPKGYRAREEDWGKPVGGETW